MRYDTTGGKLGMQLSCDLKVAFFVALFATAFSKADLAKKTKLCGDSKCAEKLFQTKIVGSYTSEHEAFLSYQVNDVANVYGIRKSDRPDLLEAVIESKPKQRGYILSSYIEAESYIAFLEEALRTNRSFFMISAEDEDQASPKVLGTKPAVPELLKELEKVRNYSALAKGLDPPPPVNPAEYGIKIESHGHGHSHAGHGHSHGGHAHSHGGQVHSHEGHGHSHEGHGHSHELHEHSHGGHGQYSHAHEHQRAESGSGLEQGIGAGNKPSSENNPQDHVKSPENMHSATIPKVSEDHSFSHLPQTSVGEVKDNKGIHVTGKPPVLSRVVETPVSNVNQGTEGHSSSDGSTPSAGSSSQHGTVHPHGSQSVQDSKAEKVQPVTVGSAEDSKVNNPDAAQNLVAKIPAQQPSLDSELYDSFVKKFKEDSESNVQPTTIPTQPVTSTVISTSIHSTQPASVTPITLTQPLQAANVESLMKSNEVDLGVTQSISFGAVGVSTPIGEQHPGQSSHNSFDGKIFEEQPALVTFSANADVLKTTTVTNLLDSDGKIFPSANNVVSMQTTLSPELVSTNASPSTTSTYFATAVNDFGSEGTASNSPLVISETTGVTPVSLVSTSFVMHSPGFDITTSVPIETSTLSYGSDHLYPSLITTTSVSPNTVFERSQVTTSVTIDSTTTVATSTAPPLGSSTAPTPASSTIVLTKLATANSIPTIPPLTLQESSLTGTTAIPVNDQRRDSLVHDRSSETEKRESFHVVDTDGLGYCIKGDCGELSDTATVVKEMGNKTSYEIFVKLASVFLLPSGEVDFIKLIFCIIATVLLSVHLLMMVFCSDSDREQFDRQMLHDALSAVKARDQRIQQLSQECERSREFSLNSVQEKLEKLRMELGERLIELQQYEGRSKALEQENESLKAQLEKISGLLESEKEKLRKATTAMELVEKSNKMISEQLVEMQCNMENARGRNDLLEKEIADKDALILRQSSKMEIDSSELKAFKEQIKILLEEKRALGKRIDDLQFENTQLSELYDEACKSENTANVSANLSKPQSSEEPAAQESGGSAGWSDIGDFDIDPFEEKKEPPTQAENENCRTRDQETRGGHGSSIIEVARLRGQLERTKLKLLEEENAREGLLKRLDLAESEAARCRKEVETKEAERIDTSSQCRKMLAMVEEKDNRIRRLDEMVERLREEKSELQVQIRNLEEQKQQLDVKLNEIEQEFKRLQNDCDRMKKRHFHELRECKQENNALQQRLVTRETATGDSSLLNESSNLLSLSGTSSERDAAPAKGLLPNLSVPPLWSDGDTDIFSGAESSRVDRNSSTRMRPIPADESYQYGPSKALRTKHREHRDGSPDPFLLRSKKEGRRMRSRSHGRSSVYLPPGMPLPHGSGYGLLGHREHKSGGNLYYSSGGSNGGLSPPPLPLISGVPPPDFGIRKPTASTRPKSVVEQAPKHQS